MATENDQGNAEDDVEVHAASLNLQPIPKGDLHAGMLLDGRYYIEKELGRGAFGVVYLARDKKLVSDRVVVKKLLEQSRQDEYAVKKIKQEVEVLKRVKHQGVVQVLDNGETPDGMPYLVMEYIEGVTLRSILRAEGLELQRVAHIVKQIGDALNAVHEVGVVHRDLKPENIMLLTSGDGKEQVKIIDFGVAKIKYSVLGLSTATPMMVGTMAYMSPEQLNPDLGKVSAATDTYSLGVMAYEMVTGRRPFDPTSVAQLWEMQREGVLVKPKDICPELSQSAERAILKALQFNPKDRYRQASGFGENLARALVAELEMAHVLFMDIVGFTKPTMDKQDRVQWQLKEIVRSTKEFSRALADNKLVSRPTGDGMALAFLTSTPIAPVQCALEIEQALRNHPEIKLRMGVHSGPVYRDLDINDNMDVIGGGINYANRVMDVGDAGHILISKAVADVLKQLSSNWAESLHDLGVVKVKHDEPVHIYNLYTNEFGNKELPKKISLSGQKKTDSESINKKRAVSFTLMVAASLLAVGVIIGAVWFMRGRVNPAPPPIVTWELKRKLEDKSGSVRSVAFSQDNRTIVSGSFGVKVTLWDTQTGTLQRTLEGVSGSNYLYAIALSPDGSQVVAGVDNRVLIWDARTGDLQKNAFSGHKSRVFSVAVSPDGKTIAGGSEDHTVILWNAQTGAKLRTMTHSDEVKAVAFSPDGETLASGSYDKTVILWDAQSGAEKRRLEHDKAVYAVAFSSDGQTLASGSEDSTITLWATQTGERKIILRGHRGAINSLAFSPDNLTLASGSDDRSVILWNVGKQMQQQALTQHAAVINTVAFSPDGKMLASGSRDQMVILWEAISGTSNAFRPDTIDKHRMGLLLFPDKD